MIWTTPLLLGACIVGKAKYEALQSQYDGLQADHAALQEEHEQLQDQLSDTEREVQSLQQALSRAEEEAQALQGQLNQLQAEKAALLKDKSALDSSVREMEKALVELAQRKAQADARVAEYRNLLARFQALIDAGKLRVKIVDGRMVVELATDVLFSSGSANLSKDGAEALKEVAAVLASIPDRRYQVEGHTDNDPIATAQYPSNWELASARALVVTRTLVAGGLPAERVSAASYGEHRPAAPNDTREGKVANRRIEIVVVPDLSTLPGFEELNRAESPR